MKTIDHLRKVIRGDVIVPGDSAYDSARRVWNGSATGNPAAIVRCLNTADVAASVRAGSDSGLELAIRGGGHSLPGFSTCDAGLVIDLDGLRSVEVRPENRLARVGGGARWADFDAATWPHRLLATGGLVSTTGVGGLTLGGGIGWLTRLCGLACDNLLAAEVVLADGTVVETAAGDHADLLWGLRGGGGNFGVVTRFDFRLHPVREIVGGLAFFPLSRTVEVGERYRDWTAGLDDAFTTMLVFVTAPDADFIPAELRGKPSLAIAGCHAGGQEQAERDLRPIRELGPAADLFTTMDYPELQSMFDADFPAGDRYHFKGGFTYDCPAAMLELLAGHLERSPGPRCEIDLHHLGGAAGRVPATATAFPERSATFAFNVITGWQGEAGDGAHRAWARAVAGDLGRFGPATTYLNFAGDRLGAEAAYGPETHGRLADLKRRYDPQNLFHLNQNIAPGTA